MTNKQGGIYTVLRSKAAVTTQELGDKYVMLGPLTPAHQHEVELCPPVTGSPLAKSLQVSSSPNNEEKKLRLSSDFALVNIINYQLIILHITARFVETRGGGWR